MTDNSVPRDELERIGDILLGKHPHVTAVEIGRRAVGLFGGLPAAPKPLAPLDFSGAISRAFHRATTP